MRLEHAGATHVGMKREHNEDNLMVLPERGLFVVADGMGGHASGEVASRIAVDTLKRFFEETSDDDDITWPYKLEPERTLAENRIRCAVKLANRNIFETALSDVRFKSMGTTLVGILWSGGQAVVAHVGDSRCYRVRDGAIEQLTEDHSLLNDYKKIAQLTPEEEANFPHKNIIVRALGMKEDVEVDLTPSDYRHGDVFVLCSDGLNGEITDDTILHHVQHNLDDLEGGVEALIQAACEAGGKDNVTVVLVRVEG